MNANEYTIGDPVLFGTNPCTVEAMGTKDGTRWTIAIADDGTIILGERGDFIRGENDEL